MRFNLANLFQRNQHSKKNRSSRCRDRVNRSTRVATSYHEFEERNLLAGDVYGPVPVDFGMEHAPVAAAVVPRIIDGTEIDPADDPHPSVGEVGDLSGFFCSGTLIAPNYVLTAAHCVAQNNIPLPDTQGTFRVGGETYGTVRVEVHPQYNDFNFSAGFDLAVFELDRPVVGITPSPLYRAVPTVGQQLTLVGFGGGGTGADGADGTFGTKRVGTTTIDGIRPQHIDWLFEDGQDPAESNTAPGDSGGPAFIDVNGTFQVAGITSGGSSAGAGFGDNSFDIRVDVFTDYIEGLFFGRDEHGNLPNPNATFIRHSADDGTVRAEGRLQRPGDHDVFRVQVQRSGFIVFRASGQGTFDSYLRAYNQEGVLLVQNNDFNGPDSRLAFSVQPGTYYFSVASLSDTERGNFNIWTKLTTFGETLPPDDHADTLDAAATIYELDGSDVAATGRQQGLLENANDRDVFQIEADKIGRAFVRVAGTGGLNPFVTIYDSLGRPVAQNDDFGGSTNAGLDFNFVPGTYYLAIDSSNRQSRGQYFIWSNFRAFVPNDDHGGFINSSTGVSLQPNATAFTSGVIAGGRDRDMFFFTANRFSREYVIRVGGMSNNLDTTLTVFNAAGERIAFNDDAFGTDSRVTFSARLGETFFVAVDGKNSSTGKFNLAIFTRS